MTTKVTGMEYRRLQQLSRRQPRKRETGQALCVTARYRSMAALSGSLKSPSRRKGSLPSGFIAKNSGCLFSPLKMDTVFSSTFMLVILPGDTP